MTADFLPVKSQVPYKIQELKHCLDGQEKRAKPFLQPYLPPFFTVAML